jgi:hypothetical protein
MTATLTPGIRRPAAGAALVAAGLVALLPGYSVGGSANAAASGYTTTTTSAAVAVSPSSSPAAAGGVPVALRFGDQLATATLVDSRAAREFAAMLPLTVKLTDRMGQAKSGRLPHSLDLTGAHRRSHSTVGEIIYWSPSDTVAIVYDGLGPTLPDPGVVRLGVVGTGLDDLADAGNRITVRIDRAAEPSPDPSS